MRKTCFGLIVGMLFFSSFALAKEFSRTEVRTFSITANGSVKVDNVNGSIRVETWDNPGVSLQVTKTVGADDSEDADDYFHRVRVEISSGDDYLHVYTHFPNEGWHGFFDWLFHGGWNHHANVDYLLRVPSTIHVEVGTVNGNSVVAGVTGGVNAHTTNGRIELQDVGGSVHSSTTNGSISASLSTAVSFTRISLHTTNGSIKLVCPDDINANVSAHTVNGGINSDFPVTINGGFVGKNLEGQINDGGPDVDMGTVNGSIEIRKR